MSVDRDAIADEDLVATYVRDPGGAVGRAALATLVARWSGRVYLWTWRFVRERERALDVSQDCLVRMIEALPRYQARGRFSAWLFTIVHNRCRSTMRRTRWLHDPEVDPDALQSSVDGPEEAYETAESRRRVADAIGSALDERERTALWLRAAEGMSVDDITHLMKIETASGARGLLQTARRKLRAALGEDRESTEERA